MACDQSKIDLVANAAQPIDHDDADMRMGHSFIAKADLPVWIGGSNVTPANGYPKDAGEEFGLNDASDLMYVVCDVNTTVHVFWSGV